MRRGFGQETYEPEEEQTRQDKEFTLGPATLIGIVFGLLLLCGLSFLLGYRTGRRSSPVSPGPAVAASGTADAAPEQEPHPGSKPPAKGMIPSNPPAGVQETPQPSSSPLGGSPQASSSPNPLTSYGPAGPAGPAGQPQVRPATLPGQPAGVQPAAGQSGGVAPASTMPAAVPASPAAQPPATPYFMVQIAAISRVDDAQVMVESLQKHGYAVITRRSPADSLIHIQVGPFQTRAEAQAMGQRLIGDGYNATILP